MRYTNSSLINHKLINNFLEVLMKNSAYRKYYLIIVSLMLVFTESAIGQTYITGGDVSGIWTSAGSPYYIQGEITVPNGEILTIEPGVNVVFLGHYKLNVQGRLIAVGTRQDSISFTADSIEIGWHGIRFMNTPNTNDTSKMVYCSFKYGKANTGSGYDRSGGAIMINGFDKVLVSNCLFDSNMQSGGGWDPIEAGPAIYFIYSSPIITNSTFSNNIGSKGAAISCLTSQNAIISNNIFSNNWGGLVGPIIIRESITPIISGNIIFDNYAGYMGGGIAVEMGSTPRIENNIIFRNEAPDAGGIICWIDVNAIIINNTIAYNVASYSGGGIRCDYNSDPILLNNIIYGNSATTGSQVYLYDSPSDPNFLYCNIQGGREEFGGTGADTNYTGLYENNINDDPLYSDTLFNLSDLSPCIGAGIDSIEISGIWYYAPSFDYDGDPRPNPPECMPDIGALESPLCIPATTISINPTFLNFGEVAIDSSSTMIFTIMNTGNADLEITNISSNEPAFTVNITSATIPPASDQVVEVTFTPTEEIQYNSIIEISHNALGSPDTVTVTGNGITGIEEELQPLTFNLEQNYPNPFNSTTVIKYSISEVSKVKITIFNFLGEEVAVVLNEEREPGFYQVEFNAINLPSGVYFYKLNAGSFVETKKMILLK